MTTDHFHVLLDCKKTYINKLTDIITEPIRKKLFDIYNYSKQLCITRHDKQNVLKQFQNELVFIPKWDNTVITEQISNICNSKNIDWLDELLKGIFISNNKIINLINNEHIVNIEIPNTKLFIHTLYINIARDCWKNPYVFYHNHNNQQIIDNIDKINKIISNNILHTIEYFLPIENIVKSLVESLKNNKDVNIKTLQLDEEYKKKLEKREHVLKMSEQALNDTKQKLKDKEDKIIKIKIESEANIHKQKEEILKKEAKILVTQLDQAVTIAKLSSSFADHITTRVETELQQLKDKVEKGAINKQTEEEEEVHRIQVDKEHKVDKAHKVDNEDKEGKEDKAHKVDKVDKEDKEDKAHKVDKVDKEDKAHKVDKVDKEDKEDKEDKQQEQKKIPQFQEDKEGGDDNEDKEEKTNMLRKQEEDIRNKKLDNAIEIAQLSSELAEKITTSAEIEVQKLKEVKSIEIDITNFNKEKNIHLSIDNDTKQDYLHSDDDISFFNDARLF